MIAYLYYKETYKRKAEEDTGRNLTHPLIEPVAAV